MQHIFKSSQYKKSKQKYMSNRWGNDVENHSKKSKKFDHKIDRKREKTRWKRKFRPDRFDNE